MRLLLTRIKSDFTGTSAGSRVRRVMLVVFLFVGLVLVCLFELKIVGETTVVIICAVCGLVASIGLWLWGRINESIERFIREEKNGGP